MQKPFFFKVILQKSVIEAFNIALMCAIVCFSCTNKCILLEPFRMCYWSMGNSRNTKIRKLLSEH